MKRMISFLFAIIMMFSIASADTLREHIGAPETLQATYQSNTGNTTITIDAEVIVPDAAAVNVYEIRARLFTMEEITRMSDAVFAGREYTPATELKTMPMTIITGDVTTQYSANPRTVKKLEGEVFPLAESSIMVTQRVLKNGMMARSEMIYYGLTPGIIAEEVITYDTEMPENGTKALGCSLSLEDARAQADTLAQQIAPQMQPAGQGVVQGWRYRDGTTGGVDEAYIFYYTPVYDLPWNFASNIMDYDYAVPSAEESLAIIISDKRVEQVIWTAPHEIVSTMEEDVTLLPFDQIQKVAAELMPLAYMYMENPLTIGVDVTRVQLGYMRVLCQDEPDKLKLVPVWDFYGKITRYKDGQLHWLDDTACNSLLTINAIDGTVIDRAYGY